MLLLGPMTLALLTLAGCGDDGGEESARIVVLSVSELPASAAGSTVLDAVTVTARWDDGDPASGVELALGVTGGGAVSPARVTTDATGTTQARWTLGALPIANTLVADAGELGSASVEVRVEPAAVLTTTTFGQVEEYLVARDTDGTTEDLALTADNTIVMAHGGRNAGLFEVATDGSVAEMALTGEPLVRPLGLAFGHDGALYVADADAKALMKVVDGVVSRLQDRDGDEAFQSPNDVAVGPDGMVFLSDPCTVRVYAVDPDSGAVLGRVGFDRVTEGGPNGVVVGPDGALWMTTENTALFCPHDDVELTASVAGLFRVPLDGAEVFGAPETIAAEVGVFGDGLAFDALGNLYVIFDTIDGLSLDESIVFVLPSQGGPLVRAFAGSGKVYANLAFGEGAFGETTMYLAMLHVGLVPGSPRGLESVEVGVKGAPLPPR